MLRVDVASTRLKISKSFRSILHCPRNEYCFVRLVGLLYLCMVVVVVFSFQSAGDRKVEGKSNAICKEVCC